MALREILPTAPVGSEPLNVVVYGYAWPISPIEPGAVQLARMLTAEGLHVIDATPVVVNPSQVSFTASPDHATVTNYTAELYTYPAHVLEGIALAGRADAGCQSNTITVDLSALYAGQPAGDYTVVIVTTTVAGGSTPSEDSNAFTLPVI